jgi:hypothetical protein
VKIISVSSVCAASPPDALLRSLQSKWGLLLSSLHAALSVLLASLSLSDSVSLRTDRSISVCTCLGTRPRTQDISRLCTCKGRPTSSSIERVVKKKGNGARHKAVKIMVPRQAFPGQESQDSPNQGHACVATCTRAMDAATLHSVPNNSCLCRVAGNRLRLTAV